MTAKILLLGNSGRAHAWALALKRSDISLINWAPKINPGIAELSDEVINASYNTEPDIPKDIDLCVIGPEAPLVIGVTDRLEEMGIIVFGPTQANAQIEGSKSYMRELLTKYDIDGNIAYTVCRSESEIEAALDNNFEVAVKPDGLTGGKGVRVFGNHLKDRGEVESYAQELLLKDGIVLLEQLLTGIEFTLQAFCNGAQMIFLPLVKDYKRAFDDDIGPNTGSMGAISYPTHKLPFLEDKDLSKAKSIVSHVARSLSMENSSYKGAIYGQFMLTDDGPKVIEFNARLGDPEAINALELLEQPVFEVITSLLNDDEVVTTTFKELATCVVYLVPEGYPSDPHSGAIIEMDNQFTTNKSKFRYASVEFDKEKNQLVTTTSRSIAIIGTGKTLESARKDAYDNLPEVQGLRHRSDIGSDIPLNKVN